MRLDGRRILVTGAGSGIGLAIARLFHKEGASLALLDINTENVKKVVDDLGRDSIAFGCDVSDYGQVQSAVASVASLGSLDGVVNVAGIDFTCSFADMDIADWHKVMAVNLTGPMHVCKAALPWLMRTGRGSIVNVASGAALRPLAGRVAYCTSKSALVMFSKALALELATSNVRVNALCPGIIDTPMLRASYENAPDPASAYSEIVSRPATGRVGSPEDIALAALYLTSEEAKYTTGSTLVVDGGRVFH